MKVTFHQSSDDDAWQVFVCNHPDARVEHDITWRDIFAHTYGYQQRYLTLGDQLGLNGVLPLFSASVWRAGRCLISMPFLDCGGPLADSPASRSALLEAARKIGNQESVAYVEIRTLDETSDGVPVRTDKAKVVLDLAGDANLLWQGLKAKVRNQVRKARKSGLRVVVDAGERADAFYQVYAHNMRDLGSPVAARSLFANTFKHFGKQARLVTVWQGETAVAGAVWLRIGSTAYVPWASALRSYFGLCPNNLLYWRAIEMACEADCRQFDFGRSTIDSGPYRFKLQWGASPRQLYWHYYDRAGGKAPQAFTDDKRLELAASAWKLLPLCVTNFLGPKIVARMP